MASRYAFTGAFRVLKKCLSSWNPVVHSLCETQICPSSVLARTLCVQIPAPPLKIGVASSKDEKREFMAVFPDIVRDLTKTDSAIEMDEVQRWYSKVLQYNVPTGKKNRGLTMVFSYKQLVNPLDLTPENLHLARVLGWCVELSYFLLLDDIMDGSSTRRGKPCWYKTNDLGVLAINDGILLEAGLFNLLKKYFKGLPYYADVMELFHQTVMVTAMGQAMDVMVCPSGKKPNLHLFTMERYKAVAEYKTAFYSFYLPVALAMHMAGVDKPELYRQAKTILIDMGYFFQVQDDYLDCFGDPEKTGKHGTDIRDGKCTWLSVVALQRATSTQRVVMEENYGVEDEACVARVQELYEELGLRKIYRRFEEENYTYLKTMAHQTSKGLPQEVFLRFMERIYQRDN